MDNFIIYIKKNKALLIITFLIWLFAIIFLIAPIAYSISEATINGAFSVEIFMEQIIPNISSFNSITKIGKSGASAIFGKSILYFTFIYMIMVGIGLYKGRKKSEYDSIEHGSSDWCQNGEQYRVLSKNNGLILAEENYLPTNKIGNVNVLIVGGSGSGKSSSYSFPNAHQQLGSYIFTDPKGEIYDRTAGYLKKNGYEVKLLNLVNPESSDSYNPLFHVKSQLDVDIIASTIVRGQKSENSNSDPYWDNMSELLLKSLIYYLIAVRPTEEQNLASCAELVRAANAEGGSSLLADLINQLPYDHPARMNFKSVALASDKTFQSILSSLQSSLGKFDSKEIADVTSTNTIDFEDIATKKTALYVVSSDTHTAYNFLLTIFFSQMIQQLYDFADKRGGKLPVPLFFILDEFANIGQIPDFDKKISTSRSRGISFSVILQNLDQLKNIYEKSYETIIGNCDTHVFLGSNSYATVEYFSKELGEKTISHNSKSVNRNSKSEKQGYSESDQIMARALMTPDELRRMDNNECIIFEKGLKPIKAKKFWWFKKNNMVRDFTSNEISHNDYKVPERGNWRKFNPNNPYQEPEQEHENATQIGSLDDLFSDIDNTTEPNNTKNSNNTNNTNNINKTNYEINANNGININDTINANNFNNINKVNANNTNVNPYYSKNNITPNNNFSTNNNINTNNSFNANNNFSANNSYNGNNNFNANNNYPGNNNFNTNNNYGANNSYNGNNNFSTNNKYTSNNNFVVPPINNGNTQSTNTNNQNDISDIDIEKELEAKFDELFGNNNNDE